MAVNQLMIELFHVLQPRNLGSSPSPTTTILPQVSPASQTPASNTSTMSSTSNSSNGPTSSPLLFFVALRVWRRLYESVVSKQSSNQARPLPYQFVHGRAIVNLLITMHRIIVGVKYCFRYNARNRALRNGEDVDPITLENMPTRPHRRRREKKLMTMDEVNERFPLTKYKSWVASRVREGLPTSGGVTAPPSRAGSIRQVEGIMPTSPTDTKHTVETRPNTSGSDGAAAEIKNLDGARKSMDAKDTEKGIATATIDEQNRLEAIPTSTSTVDKHLTHTDEDDDEDDHIHTAVPPELLTNPGDSCAICIDTLEEDDDIRGLTCGHAFHAGCLDPWLTSRRACCPLCKADYFTPKPRPEGEAVETTERSGRRRDRGANMPQPPQSAWTGIRGGSRLMLPGRFGTPAAFPGDAPRADQSRAARRARRAAEQNDTGASLTDGAADNAATAAPRRWVPRIANPFRRNQPAAEPTEPSPAQLEAGVVR